MTRLNVLKTVLWAALGAGLAAIVLRLFAGLGATTNLSSLVSWGVWNAVKISIVPLSAGAFVMAAIVHIFGMLRFRPLLRLCILTGFLGYSTFSTMLLFDIGLPYRIWHPMVYWQHHSVLFEVAMCVMAYLTVLALEFTPTALEHEIFAKKPLFQTVFRMLKKVSIILVITGIVLSTLHQSSLGSLFLIVPHRLHALWYSPVIYLLFFSSAIGMGLLVISIQAFLLEYFFRFKAPMELLAPLARAGAVFLGLFMAIRLGDQIARGVLAESMDAMALVYLLEIVLIIGIPALLFLKKVRESRAGLFTCALSAAAGVVLYRSDVALLAIDWGGAAYFPALAEILVTVGILAGVCLVFLFLVENLKIYGSAEVLAEDHVANSAWATITPESSAWFGGVLVYAPRRYSMIASATACIAAGILISQTLWNLQPLQTPVQGPRTAQGIATARTDGPGNLFVLAGLKDTSADTAKSLPLTILDGNRNGRLVLFPHKEHESLLGDAASCAVCHHQNKPFDSNTSCHECHSDMYEATDTFEHMYHVDKLGGNDGCIQCHTDSTSAKTRDTAVACSECHADMVVPGSRVAVPASGLSGFAPGYMDAMHGLCIGCHKEEKAAQPESFDASFDRCDGCHGIMDGSALESMGPYASVAGSLLN